MYAYRPKFLLRWRFEWADRPTKFGMWSHAGRQQDLETKAWCNHKEKLLYAMVEAKDYEKRNGSKVVVAVSGQDFMNFQWLALALAPAFKLEGPTVPITLVGGIKILTRYEEILVHDCGKVTRSPNTAANINFATYGK